VIRLSLLSAFAMLALSGCVLGESGDERALPSKPRVILRDDFSDAETGWATGVDAVSSTRYAHGRLRVRVTKPHWSVDTPLEIGEVVEALRVEVDVVQAEGEGGDAVGIVCEAHVGARDVAGYSLSIDPNDGWVGTYWELEHNDHVLEERYEPDTIRPGRSVNRLRADCIGATRDEPAVIALYVNGRLVTRAEDADGFPRFDGVGLLTANERGDTVAVYDNLVASEMR
jgi:hypothetical protein